MKFTPKSEQEITRESLFEKGTYSFEVTKSENKVSKSGNSMIKLQLVIFANESDLSKTVYDYIMPSLAFKLRHFCKATGLLEKYEKGTLDAEDCEGKTGKCYVGIEEDESGKYMPKNTVKDYMIDSGANTKEMFDSKAIGTDRPLKSKGDDLEDDDIQF